MNRIDWRAMLKSACLPRKIGFNHIGGESIRGDCTCSSESVTWCNQLALERHAVLSMSPEGCMRALRGKAHLVCRGPVHLGHCFPPACRGPKAGLCKVGFEGVSSWPSPVRVLFSSSVFNSNHPSRLADPSRGPKQTRRANFKWLY